ncbi:FAD-dependent oxidoreductase [Deinococcus altitudinis]|uniref:FAD-dependent oxidoreductase n=1 Tax=Deinococcus altitudinis TaxID=468914 RepID=UPI0038922264
MRIVVVGGVAAGMSAASRARRQDPDAEVVVFERGEYVSYGACGLPYVLSGQAGDSTDDFGALVARTPAQMRARGISVRLRHEVLSVDAGAATTLVRDLNSGQTRTEPYDHLLLATGVAPVRPDWENLNAAGVHVLREIPDAQAIGASLGSGAKRAVVIGGGYIGLEMAEALHLRGLKVVLLESAPQVAGRMLDRQYRAEVGAELERGGIEVRAGVNVEGLHARAGRVTGVQTDAGTVRADLVIVAVGVRPRVELAQSAGVRLGRTGAIATDARMQTSVPGIWAAGDNAESLNRVSRRKVHLPLGLGANRMGRVAGVNMAGGEAKFPGVVGSAVFRVLNLSVARTGLTHEEALALGLDAVSADVRSTDHAGYFHDARPLQVRLTAERGTGRLLGAQFLGHGDAVKRVDVVAALLHGRGKVQALAEMDLAYAPPFSSVWDVLLVVAGKLRAMI